MGLSLEDRVWLVLENAEGDDLFADADAEADDFSVRLNEDVAVKDVVSVVVVVRYCDAEDVAECGEDEEQEGEVPDTELHPDIVSVGVELLVDEAQTAAGDGFADMEQLCDLLRNSTEVLHEGDANPIVLGEKLVVWLTVPWGCVRVVVNVGSLVDVEDQKVVAVLVIELEYEGAQLKSRARASKDDRVVRDLEALLELRENDRDDEPERDAEAVGDKEGNPLSDGVSVADGVQEPNQLDITKCEGEWLDVLEKVGDLELDPLTLEVVECVARLSLWDDDCVLDEAVNDAAHEAETVVEGDGPVTLCTSVGSEERV